jgi:hypothetical protein
MKFSVSVIAEGDRLLALEEIVALADAVATMSGIASGIGTMSYGAQIIIEAPSADEAVELAIPSFAQAAAQANLPPWPITRAEVISEEDDLLGDE